MSITADPLYQHALRLVGKTADEPMPEFRCDACFEVGPIAWQYRTVEHRYCPACAPAEAVRSQLLELGPSTNQARRTPLWTRRFRDGA